MRFKTFLLEQILVHPRLVLEIATQAYLTTANFKPLKKKLISLLKCSTASIDDIDDEMIIVEFKDLTQQQLQIKYVEDLEKQVISIIDKYLTELSNRTDNDNEITSNDIIVICDGGLPSFPISSSKIILINCNGDTIISGISKLITECMSLRIYDIDQLKPQGMLDFLRLPRDVEDLQFGWENKHPEWNKIITKHFKTDRDIIDCKEELMANGFKEWAKL